MLEQADKGFTAPQRLYGRLTKQGPMNTWVLQSVLKPLPTHEGVARYQTVTGQAGVLTKEGLVYGMQNGHLIPQDGKEILAWGKDFSAQLARLDINAVQLFDSSRISSPYSVPSVYWVSDGDFAKLEDDSEENWEGHDAAWCYSDGCNLGDPETRVRINGHYLNWAWPDRNGHAGVHYSLMEYLESNPGATNMSNVAACVAELAHANDMTIGALFTKYQPRRGSVTSNA